MAHYGARARAGVARLSTPNPLKAFRRRLLHFPTQRSGDCRPPRWAGIAPLSCLCSWHATPAGLASQSSHDHNPSTSRKQSAFSNTEHPYKRARPRPAVPREHPGGAQERLHSHPFWAGAPLAHTRTAVGGRRCNARPSKALGALHGLKLNSLVSCQRATARATPNWDAPHTLF